MLKMYVIATVHETKQTWAAEDDFQVITPNLNITVSQLTLSKPTSLLIT